MSIRLQLTARPFASTFTSRLTKNSLPERGHPRSVSLALAQVGRARASSQIAGAVRVASLGHCGGHYFAAAEGVGLKSGEGGV